MKVLLLAASSLVLTSFLGFTAMAQNPGSAAPAKSSAAKSRVKKTRVPAAEETETSVAPTSVSRVRASSSGQSTWDWAKERMSVGGFLSSAGNFTLDGASVSQGNQGLKGAGDMSTDSSMGVEAQLIEYKNENWGWFAGASIEQKREIGSLRVNLTNNSQLRGNFRNKPSYRPLIVSGGAVYRYNDKIYGTAGLNYTIYKEFGSGDIEGGSMDAKPGFQVAAAFQPAPRLAFEVAYRDVRYSFGGRLGQTRIGADNMNLAGVQLVGRYSLE